MFEINPLTILAALVVLVVLAVLFWPRSSETTAPALVEPPEVIGVLTVYSGGKVVGRWEISDYSTGDGRLYAYRPEGEDAIVVGGDYLFEPLDLPAANPALAKYRVTLYSGGEPIKAWDAESYSTGDNRMYVYLPGDERAIVVGGGYVIVPIR
jgi:hypothetical protein